MATLEELLAGIRAHPADDLRRLVFADWLEENANGDPLRLQWASYIRWAIAASRTPRTDPDYWKYRRYPEVPPPGLKKWFGLDTLQIKFDWSGGFPDTLTLAVDTLLAHDRRLAAVPTPLRRLKVVARLPFSTVWVNGPTVARSGELEVQVMTGDYDPLLNSLSRSSITTLPPLKLDFGSASVASIEAFARRDYPSLVGLTLPVLESPRVLLRSNSLHGVRSLEVSGHRLQEPNFAGLARRFPRLNRLKIDRNALPDFLHTLAQDASPELVHLETEAVNALMPQWREFVSSPAFSRLQRLHWSAILLQENGGPIWPANLAEPEAGNLILNVSHLGSARMMALLSSPMLHRCSCLFIENSTLTPEAYIALADNPAARNLKVLSIQMPFKSLPFASGVPFARLTHSPHLAGLTELSLTFHDLTDDDFQQLLTATFAPGLRYLNLAGSYFSEWVLAPLVNPDVLPELTWLDLHKPTNGSTRLEAEFQKRFGPHFAF